MSGEAKAATRDPIIALVVARGENGAIGIGGDLPWRLSTDLKQFRKVTLGKPIVMGRRTFQSLLRVLDQRVNIVLSRDAGLWRPAPLSPAAWRRRSRMRAAPRRMPVSTKSW